MSYQRRIAWGVPPGEEAIDNILLGVVGKLSWFIFFIETHAYAFIFEPSAVFSVLSLSLSRYSDAYSSIMNNPFDQGLGKWRMMSSALQRWRHAKINWSNTYI